MPDCPHNHIQDSGLQAFREIIREKTDGGQTIVDFLNDAADGNLPKFEPHHRIQASEILVRYGFKGADEPAKQHNDSQPKPVLSSVEGTPSANRSRSAPGAPALRNPVLSSVEGRMTATPPSTTSHRPSVIRPKTGSPSSPISP